MKRLKSISRAVTREYASEQKFVLSISDSPGSGNSYLGASNVFGEL